MSRNTLVKAVGRRRQYVLQAIDCLVAEGQLRPEGLTLVPDWEPVPGTTGTTWEPVVPGSPSYYGNRNHLPSDHAEATP